ncbi:hypothetical protein [Prevotella sp.]|uniref:hypothetical protein n=1 Tax=Prevotella sp. TaxID=59823 RepID=UPI003AB3345A
MKTVLKAGSDTAGSVAEVFFMCNVSRQLSGTAFLSALSRAGPVRITPGARLFYAPCAFQRLCGLSL